MRTDVILTMESSVVYLPAGLQRGMWLVDKLVMYSLLHRCCRQLLLAIEALMDLQRRAATAHHNKHSAADCQRSVASCLMLAGCIASLQGQSNCWCSSGLQLALTLHPSAGSRRCQTRLPSALGTAG
jgi:hypothetical protein